MLIHLLHRVIAGCMHPTPVGSCGYGYLFKDEPLGWDVAAATDFMPGYEEVCMQACMHAWQAGACACKVRLHSTCQCVCVLHTTAPYACVFLACARPWLLTHLCTALCMCLMLLQLCGQCVEISCDPSWIQDNYGQKLDRTVSCYDSSESVVVRVTDTCPCA